VERLHKVLAHAGVASRRKCEELIASGRVTVNDEIVSTPGTKVDPERVRIKVDGVPIALPDKHAYVLLHKPVGVLSAATDPRGRPTVLDLVPTRKRLYPVGRLDLGSEGLVLLTDDGELTQRLTHPSYKHEKEYHILVEGRPAAGTLRRLREGIELEDGFSLPAKVAVLRREGRETWLRFVIREGRKRQLRRMCAEVGHPVRRLVRVRMGVISLGELLPGQYRSLMEQEVAELLTSAGLASRESSIRSQGHPQERPCDKDPTTCAHGLDREESVAELRYPDPIAIDGPAAAGKSTVGERLAKELGFLYFDTGVMYRAVTWVAMQRGIPVEDEIRIGDLAEQVRIDVLPAAVKDGRQYTVQVDGADVTWDLRRPEVDFQVSPVSAYPRVRAALTAQQRRIGQQGKVIMVGRVIDTTELNVEQVMERIRNLIEERRE